MPPVIVGVDAGGTSTVAAAQREMGELRLANGEAANAATLGVETAADRIARAIEQALQGETASAIAVGAAGAGDEEIARALQRALHARFPNVRIEVCADPRIALRAGAPDGDAIALIAGTGSIAYAEIGGVAYRAGGYGHLIGDDGSGFAIGSAAVRLLMRAHDGRVPFDSMLSEIAAQLGAQSASEVVVRVSGSRSAVRDLAALAPVVIAAADAGERSATKIVQTAALELFEMLRALMRKASVGDRALPLVFAGGLLSKNSMLTFLLETRVNGDAPHLQPMKGVPPPYAGALTLARQLAQSV